MNFRVLMQDNAMGFKFAIMVKGINTDSPENLAQYGATTEDGARWNAGSKALEEFPDAFLVEIKQVMPYRVIGGYESEYLGTY